MSSIQEVFSENQAYIGYLTAGHSDVDRFVDACLALVEGGVDILEIGIPFTDPIADGPVIQKAMNHALSEGVTPKIALDLIREVRSRTSVPIVLFTYYNPIFTGGKKFLKEAKQAGCEGILVVDLPIEEAGPLLEMTDEVGLDPIFVVTPSTPTSRIRTLGEVSRGFVYYACRKGTTGVRDGLPDDFSSKIKNIKQEVKLPVAAGFGISNSKVATEVIQHADGFVVGSAFVKALEEDISISDLQSLVKDIDPRQ